MSDLLFSAAFDVYRNHINVLKRSDWSWDEIRTHRGKADEDLDRWFLMQTEFSLWPSLGESPAARWENWLALVDAKRVAEEEMMYAARPLVVLGREEVEPGIQVPLDDRACWPLYKAHLLSNSFKKTAVDSIEESSLKIVRRLRPGPWHGRWSCTVRQNSEHGRADRDGCRPRLESVHRA